MKLTSRLVTLLAVFLVVGGAQAGPNQSPRLNLAVSPGISGTVSTSDGRVRCASGCRIPYRRGTLLTLRAKAAPHYLFDRWFGDCIGVAPICTIALDRDIAATARFVGEPVQLALSVGGPGKVTSDPPGIDCGGDHYLCSLEVPYGSGVTLTPAPDNSGRFAGWDGPCAAAGTGPCDVIAQPTATAAAFGHASPTPGMQPLTVTLFDYLAHVTSNPRGIDCPPTCTASFGSGTVVTLYHDRGLWQPACIGEKLDRCAIVVDAPTQVGIAPPAPPPPPPPPPPPRTELLLTVSRGGGGLVKSSDGKIRCGWSPKPQFFCSDLLPVGPKGKSVLRLATRAGARARFARWGGACRGTKATCRLELAWTGREPDQHAVSGLFRRR